MIYDALKEYEKSEYYGFHMPGHKRNDSLIENNLPYGIDITEIPGFDDLHHPTGLILEAQKRAARLFGAGETCFLINGSTVGILSSILGTTQKGDKVLVARNCHRSVYHAIELNELKPIYLYPHEDGDILKFDVDQVMEENKDIKVVIVTSPTYEGVVSDIRQIAESVHKYDIPLIVDEAHGAHFGFHSYFPQNANALGADIVIHSVHKTLPSLTQTALLHMNGERVDRKRVKKYLAMLQSSSPSYVLMASIDSCMDFLEKNGQESFEKYANELRQFRNELMEMKNLQLIDGRMQEPSKILISTKYAEIESRQLEKILNETYHLQAEMVAGESVLFMTSVADTKVGFERLKKALIQIDSEIGKSKEITEWENPPRGRTTGEGVKSENYIYLYPPGIPIVIPGEIITEEIRGYLKKYKDAGFVIYGDEDE